LSKHIIDPCPPPILQPPKPKVQLVFEGRVRDLDCRALAGEHDVITLRVDLARGSSLLKVRGGRGSGGRV